MVQKRPNCFLFQISLPKYLKSQKERFRSIFDQINSIPGLNDPLKTDHFSPHQLQTVTITPPIFTNVDAHKEGVTHQWYSALGNHPKESHDSTSPKSTGYSGAVVLVLWEFFSATSAKSSTASENPTAPHFKGIRWHQNFWCRRLIFFFFYLN
jgi:hypothetical protein